MWPVRIMCDELSVSHRATTRRGSSPQSPRAIANRELLIDIRRIHAQHRNDPKRHASMPSCAPRIKLSAASGSPGHAPAGHPGPSAAPLPRLHDRQQTCAVGGENLLDQNFVADRPTQVWLPGITYIRTAVGWLYMAVTLDPFTRKGVGWAMRDHMHAEMTIDALTMASQRRSPRARLIRHSSRGSQYAAKPVAIQLPFAARDDQAIGYQNLEDLVPACPLTARRQTLGPEPIRLQP